MASRKDKYGRVLRKGEFQRADGRYSFSYTNLNKKRCVIYSKSLNELRILEQEILCDLAKKKDPLYGSKMTVAEMLKGYMDQKNEIRENTKVNYQYTIDKFILDEIGNMVAAKVKPEDIKSFYYRLLEEKELSRSTLENVHTVLHPAFEYAIQNRYLTYNPTVGLMKPIKKKYKRGKRHALTRSQQERLMDFLKHHNEFASFRNIIIAFLGTGCRIAELTGLRWSDVDFDRNTVDINHQIPYYKGKDGTCRFRPTDELKTEESRRSIPLFSAVREALLDEYEMGMAIGFSTLEIEGYTDFIFTTYDGNLYTPTSINSAIKRIIKACNQEEIALAKKEKREPVLLPHFSAHSLRHTFCTRLCEVEDNIKLIQHYMGHSDIQVTMNIYAEISREKSSEAGRELDGKLYIC